MNSPLPRLNRTTVPYRPPNARGHWDPATFAAYVLPRTNQLGAGRTPLPMNRSRKP